ncbi:hypothetical protein I317_00095 [Kwoniella heveanensis CBS 569]|uniref:BHLH domain-containing protein n=1 Tax=Kwoniella heveanensis BCC8398 TaxID=1296120 RepID=A0A1B9H1N2_9TREE|nr:hypothetical protein I316_01088 [Kwoniella heveanensis BCC8398]OCF46007.1 hypothetical protein I317_00095 [Kwoniella heveanensis CBS 569]
MSVAAPRPGSLPATHHSPTAEFLDPQLADQPTLNSIGAAASSDLPAVGEPSSSSSVGGNPLNEFAQQVLGHEEDAENLLDFGRGGQSILEEQSFGDLLQNEERRERSQKQLQNQNQGAHDDDDPGLHIHHHDHNDPSSSLQGGEYDPHGHGHEHLSTGHNESTHGDLNMGGDGLHPTGTENGGPAGDENGRGEGIAGGQDALNGGGVGVVQHTIYGGRIGKRKRIPGVEETVTDADGHPIEPQEYVRLKKDSHKEVERRRRENINDGINEIAQLIPGGLEKQGKGNLLKRAATYIIEMSEKVARADEEAGKREVEKQDLEAQLAHLQAQLRDEHARSLRFETSWREAEDRAASSNFELERLKAEVEELKAASVPVDEAMAGTGNQ